MLSRIGVKQLDYVATFGVGKGKTRGHCRQPGVDRILYPFVLTVLSVFVFEVAWADVDVWSFLLNWNWRDGKVANIDFEVNNLRKSKCFLY